MPAKTAIPQEQRANSGRDEQGRFVKGHKGRFKPGESGNPNGRPPGNSVTEQIKAKLPKVHPADPEGRTNSELIADVLLDMAINKDLGAIKEVVDRSEGKVPNKNEHSGPGGRPIEVEQKRAEDYEGVIGRLTGSAPDVGTGEPVDSSQPD